MKMTKMTLAMERSPFYKEREEKPTKDMKGRVPLEAFNELEAFFNVHYGDRSKGVRAILMDFLNNLCQEQKYFRNLQAIMLLPRSVKASELNQKGALIGFVDVEDNFKDLALFYSGSASYKNNFRFIYTLEYFNKTNYNLLGLHKLDKSYLFDIDKKTQDDFESVKKRLSELYPDIDLDDAYFVMFNLNNYLDIEDKGQFMSKTSTYSHEGVIVLVEDFKHMACARLKWAYLDGDFSLDVEFHHISHFNSKIMLELSNRDIFREYGSIHETVTREEAIKRKINSYKAQIKHLETSIEKAQKELDKIQDDK